MAFPKRPWFWTQAFVLSLSFMMIMSLSMEITNSFEFFILVPKMGSISLYGTGYGTFFDPSTIYDDGPLGGVFWILFVLFE